MFKTILVPVDFNDVVRQPLEMALELARASGGHVILFSVVDDAFPNPDILSFQLPWADYYHHMREEAVRRLEKLKEESGAGDETEVCVVRGNPARMIVRFAEEEGCDLVVMTTHRTRALRTALVGSVTRRVLHQVEVPVMVIHLHGEEAARPEAAAGGG